MIETINQYVKPINQAEEDIAVMDGEIFEIQMEKLNKVIESAKQCLQFEPIYKYAFGEEAGYYLEEEYFQNEECGILRGTLVYYSEKFYEETEDGHVDIYTEIFLLEDGSLREYHTLSEIYHCGECDQFLSRSKRVACKDQSLYRLDIEAIINNIEDDLKIIANSLEERKMIDWRNWIV